ncbi:DNA topoisomerase III [Marinomonas balearica]|uniref:DNA topoisomerase n=1 Tax=Marinomonas balearica TaxID=491947 RepID=A0A4R6MD80_9GAMM|nr:DNA topoisomerase III [Marinomonas balearica]TDO99474.1 DNA topoisomerase-3 [Marinomonas balearica]
MILYIAEKPSLARAIAAALPSPQKKEDGCIWLPNGDCVSWCIGHLLEQAEPHAYNPIYKSWSLDHLPIIPSEWKWQEKSQTKKQLTKLKKLIKQADQLVHAGDPDREGQLLVDEVLHYTKVPKKKLQATKRLLVSDLTPTSIKKSLNKLKSNSEFSALSRSALARARADWMYGLNLTRAYTIKGRQAGYQGVLSIGRVQTPILGLVVKRDLEIENFVSKDYFQVHAHLATTTNDNFIAGWQPSDACKPHMDEDGRVINKALAENVARRITQKPGKVIKAEYNNKRQPPPLPYSLSSLQIDAAKRWGLSAQQVLDACQDLYEKHQMISYPRSDCRYLPVEQMSEIQPIVRSLKNTSSEISNWSENANLSLKSNAWNDKKVGAHHAIIPTPQTQKYGSIGRIEKQVYELIVRQYLMQFYSHYEYLAAKIVADIEGGTFSATGSTPLKQGWKLLLGANSNNDDKKNEEATPNLPKLTQGDELFCRLGEVIQKQTKPPSYFTDATLLGAMTGIAKYVEDRSIKSVLKETDGLGTEATRASIIELLFKRQFLYRDSKQIKATEAGRLFVACLPQPTITPDMTAVWESTLSAISERQASYEEFMDTLESTLNQLLQEARNIPLTSLTQLAKSTPAKSVRTSRKATTAKKSKGSYTKRTYKKKASNT